MQREAAGIARSGWDAVVVGAGPAGSAAAKVLAEAGCRTLLLERHGFPREKVCGDGLLPDALAELARLGLDEPVRRAGRRCDGADVYSPAGHKVEMAGEFVLLRRSLLDEMLARAAVAAGACFVRGRLERIVRAGDGGLAIHLRGSAEPFAAAACIAAVGATGRAGIEGLPGPARRPDGVGLRRYVVSPDPPPRPVVSFGRGALPGYAWAFPLPDGICNVGIGLFRDRRGRLPCRPVDAFVRLTAGSAAFRQLMEGSVPAGPLQGGALSSLLQTGEAAGEGSVLLAGEALGTTLPLTGEGVGTAIESGMLAARALLRALGAGRPELAALDYAAGIEGNLVGRHAGYRAAQGWISRPWLIDWLASRAARSRKVSELFGAILSGQLDPRTVFSPRGLVGLLLS